MRFNAKELLAVANQPSYKFDKEGILFVKEKQDSFFRKSDVCLQRWCKLRGNLLFYCKTKEQCSEIAGMYILEECSLKLEENTEMANSFSLVFYLEEQGQQFAAISENERDRWIQALHMASYEYMRLQLSSLQAKLKEKQINTKCHTDELSTSKRQRSFTTTERYDPREYEPFLEISLSCDNLLCDGDGQSPNAIVCVSVNQFPSVNWTKYSQTEIIENSSNPSFLTTVSFVRSEISELTRIKLSVYDVRERVTCTSTLLGESVFTVETLAQSLNRTLRLTLVSPSFSAVGFITISAWQLNDAKRRNAWLLLPEVESLWSKVERPRSYSLPSRLTAQTGVPVLGILSPLCSNFMTQTYRFHTGLGAELHVKEIMSESKLSFSIPCMLLDLWIDEEKKLLDTVTNIGQITSDWQQNYLAATESHLQLINYYTEVIDILLKQKGTSFKRSSKKFDTNLEYVPVNLHLQRMQIQNVTTKKTGVYDIITVGAFSAISRRFSNGGLLRQLNEMKKKNPISSDNSCRILGCDPASRSAEAVLRIEKLQEELEDIIQNLTMVCDFQCQETVQSLLTSLSDKGDELTSICSSDVVESSISLWESLRTKTASPILSHNFTSYVKNTKVVDDQSESTLSASKEKSDIFEKESNSSLLNQSFQDINEQIYPNQSTDKVESLFEEDNFSNSTKRPEEIEPLDLTHLNIKASIMCMIGKIQAFMQNKIKNPASETVEEDVNKRNSWAELLRSSIKKLRQATQCLLKTAKITYSMISLQESTKSLPLCQQLRHRRDVVFSQALTALITGLLVRFWCHSPDSMFIYMLQTVGVLCHFEGLLSCYGNDMGILEDMIVGIDDLRRVLFWLEPSSNKSNPQPRILGNRLSLNVFLPAPESIICLLPAEQSKGIQFTVTSVFFNIGINEKATLAEKFGDTSLQDTVNQDSLNMLKEHFVKFQRTAKDQKSLHFAENHLVELLDEIQMQISAKRSKNVEILHLSSEVCKHMAGIRFTSCKSAKDRTSMSVTLEQAMVLLKEFNLDEKELDRVLECMRSEGTRRENTLKNTGVRKYHFNSLQRMALPKLYRPPAGTFGIVES